MLLLCNSRANLFSPTQDKKPFEIILESGEFEIIFYLKTLPSRKVGR